MTLERMLEVLTSSTKEAPVEGYVGQQFVGIDLHRRRSVIVRMDAAGAVLESVQVVNDADGLAQVMARAGEAPEVVLEATYGWYWAVDALQAAGANVHLAHPLGVKAFEYRRVKNDVRSVVAAARRQLEFVFQPYAITTSARLGSGNPVAA